MGIGAALIGASAQKDAAETQAEAAQQQAQAATEAAQIAAQQQQQQFEQGLALSQPFIDAGQQGLAGLQSLATPEGQAQALQAYSMSPLYQQQLEAGSENVLRGQSATGALRTGQADFALGSLPIQMQQQYLQNQQGRLAGLAGLGAQASGQAFGGFQNLGSNLANTTMQGANAAGQYNTLAAQYNAQAGSAFPMAAAGAISDITGLALAAGTGGLSGLGGLGAMQSPVGNRAPMAQTGQFNFGGLV